MSGRFEPFEKYKTSGVERIGDIPIHWNTLPLKGRCRIVNGSTPKSDVDGYWDGSIVWVTPADLSGLDSPYVESGGRCISEAGYQSCGTQIVPSGSVILSSRAPIGTVAIAATQMCTNQGCKSLVVSAGFDSKFLYYGLSIWSKSLNDLGRGATFLELSSGDLGRFQLACPDTEEQFKIAKFLDYETAKIDALIEKQQKLIALLKEKRQAVISHAVTKGLNPDAPMRDSGVEWLGEVPAHWISTKLKHHVRQIVDGAHFTPTYVDDGVPFLRVTDIQTFPIDNSSIKFIPKVEHNELIKRCLPECGDLLLSKNGTIGVPRIVDWEWEFSIFVSLCLIKLKKTLDVRFLFYFFLTHQIQEQIFGLIKQSTVINLHLDKIENFWLAVPPYAEQKEIVEYLDEILKRYDLQIQSAEAMNDLLKERRTALISAAVTGKIDVRSWKPPESKPATEAA